VSTTGLSPTHPATAWTWSSTLMGFDAGRARQLIALAEPTTR
jgi:hypothetical protein